MKAKYIVLCTGTGRCFAGYEDELTVTTGSMSKAQRFDTKEEARAVCRDLNHSDSMWIVVQVT